MILRVPLESGAQLQVGTMLLLWPRDPEAAIPTSSYFLLCVMGSRSKGIADVGVSQLPARTRALQVLAVSWGPFKGSKELRTLPHPMWRNGWWPRPVPGTRRLWYSKESV